MVFIKGGVRPEHAGSFFCNSLPQIETFLAFTAEFPRTTTVFFVILCWSVWDQTRQPKFLSTSKAATTSLHCCSMNQGGEGYTDKR